MTPDQIDKLINTAELIGGKGWEIAVRGAFATSVTGVVMACVALFVGAALVRWSIDPLSNDDEDWLETPVYMFAAMGGALFFGIGMIGIASSLSCLVAPEWCALKSLIPTM